jgi:hypothetical protein
MVRRVEALLAAAGILSSTTVAIGSIRDRGIFEIKSALGAGSAAM